MGSARDLVDMASLVRSTSTRDDSAHVRDVIHRPRDLQRALDALGPLGTATRTDVSDLTVAANTVTKGSSRSYSTSSRLLSSGSKRQGLVSGQTADIRTVGGANKTTSTSVNFLSLAASRDAMAMMGAQESSVGNCSSRMISSSDFSRQQASETSRLRRELTTPYSDLGVHRPLLGSAGVYKAVETLFAPHESLVSTDTLTSSRERLYEMMKQYQFCDAVMATNLHSIKVHKAIICSASAYLCGVLSQTNMGKRGGRTLTVQFKADIPAPSLNAFIDFIYLGRVALSVKNARDLHVMARCLHMETLKKASEEVLWTANLNSDTDLNIPELLLLEQHVDRRDQACSANLPSPREAPATQDVGVVTDACHAVSTSSNVACQTESSPASAAVAISSSGLSGERRSAPNALWVGGLGTLSLNAKGTVSVRASGKSGGPHSPVTNTPETAAHLKSSSVVAATTNTTTIASATAPITNPHHKKQLASEACRSRSGAVSDLASSRPVEGRGSAINAVQADSSASRSVIKSRKRQTSCTSLDKDMTYPSPLPGQTVRTIHHSYGTRAAARTPAKDLVTPFPQALCKENGKSSASSLPKPKMETSGAGSAAILMSDEVWANRLR
ncbi:uncharacterized protein LOC112559131 [Pomacea canaliculata]|uniref:uncharacterized protein LOC112559131 n=1 Tax=Pomacea canaliculata TaxID=400727 RepID=UPI000D73D2C6|nr:uncharacterized protein LOC112559131 [Pomacea canaliculata]